MAAAAYWRQSLINNPFKSCNKQLTCFLFREILCSKVQEKCNTRRQTDRLLANHRKSYRETASKEADQSPWKLHRLFGKVLHGQTVWPDSSRIQSGSSNFENWQQYSANHHAWLGAEKQSKRFLNQQISSSGRRMILYAETFPKNLSRNTAMGEHKSESKQRSQAAFVESVSVEYYKK